MCCVVMSVQTDKQTDRQTFIHIISRRYIYFTDWGDRAKIERADGDGLNRRMIVEDRISSPQGLAIDLKGFYTNYWIFSLPLEWDFISNAKMYIECALNMFRVR